MWAVGVSVSGGVTGHRVSRVKRDGEVRLFETREEAQAEADRLAGEHQYPPFSPSGRPNATFDYWVEEA